MANNPVIESQLIVRFPQEIAEKLAKTLDEQKSKEYPCDLQLKSKLNRSEDDVESMQFTLKIDGKEHQATLLELPCILETYKTIDCINLFKSNDVSQMLYVHREGEEAQVPAEVALPKVVEIQPVQPETASDREGAAATLEKRKMRKQFAHSGITPPLRFVRQKFFRKMPRVARQLIIQHEKKLEAIQKELQQTHHGKVPSTAPTEKKRKYKRIFDNIKKNK